MATVMIIGCGALGCRVAPEVNADRLILVDFDIVQEGNLDRTTYTTEDVGRQKVHVLQEQLPHASAIAAPFSKDTSVENVDCLVDCTDNMQTKLLVNDVARKKNISLVVGAAAEHAGMAFTTGTACWQCIVQGKTAVDDCSTGIAPETAAAVASTQVRMIHAVLAGKPESDLGRISGTKEVKVAVQQNPSCDACQGTYTYLNQPFTLQFCPGTRKLQARPSAPRKIDLSSIENVVEQFPSAVRATVEEGTALIHQHGLVEFEGVSREGARAYMQKLQ